MARRRYNREAPSRTYRKLYIIATEGDKTEPAYFAIFQNRDKSIKVRILDSKHKSAPKKILKRMEDYIHRQGLKKGDAVWLVMDRDSWQESVLNQVWKRCREKGYSLAVSNPCFEYWLLLHFDNGSGVTNAKNCRDKLVTHLPNFGKGHVETKKLSPGIGTAINYAEQKDVPPCERWPATNGSTVYRLVKELL